MNQNSSTSNKTRGNTTNGKKCSESNGNCRTQKTVTNTMTNTIDTYDNDAFMKGFVEDLKRLSPQYKDIIKNEVEPPKIPENRKTNRSSPKNKIRKFLTNAILNRRTEKKNRAKTTIGRFMRNTTVRRRSTFLNDAKNCNDADFCLTFGIERNKIKDFFGNFQRLTYIKPPILRVGAESKNGFIFKIHYNRDKFNAFAILKSSLRERSDNLAYEYFVGQELNAYKTQFPNLVETYALYKYKNEETWATVNDLGKVDKNFLFDGLQMITNGNIVEPEIIRESCVNSKYLAILVENIKKSPTFEQHLSSRATFWTNHLIYILFQVYALLHSIRDEFTHYDLHARNVLIYEPSKFQYLQYIYHLSPTRGDIVAFNSRYIAKIVDYGRSFIKGNNDSDTKSNKILNMVCDTNECGKDSSNRCGGERGYGLLNPPGFKNLFRVTHIHSGSVNNSHDLRLMAIIKYYYENSTFAIKNDVIKSLLEKIEIKKEGNAHNPAIGYPSKINNVSDAFFHLKDAINNPALFDKNNKYYDTHGMAKIGTLHIYLYGNKPMKFERGV